MFYTTPSYEEQRIYASAQFRDALGKGFDGASAHLDAAPTHVDIAAVCLLACALVCLFRCVHFCMCVCAFPCQCESMCSVSARPHTGTRIAGGAILQSWERPRALTP